MLLCVHNKSASFSHSTCSKNHELECEFEEIKCLKAECGKSLRRVDLAYHLEKDCPMRSVRCRNCGQEEAYKNIKVFMIHSKKKLLSQNRVK